MTRLEEILNKRTNGYMNFLCRQYEECAECPFFNGEGAIKDSWGGVDLSGCPLTNEKAKEYLLEEVKGE